MVAPSKSNPDAELTKQLDVFVGAALPRLAEGPLVLHTTLADGKITVVVTVRERDDEHFAIANFVEKLQSLKTDDERAELIGNLRANVCLDCGSLKLPCYCMRDE